VSEEAEVDGVSWWTKLFGGGRRAPLTPEGEARLAAEARLDEQRRKVIEDYRSHGKY
jgi:hypothetical protein